MTHQLTPSRDRLTVRGIAVHGHHGVFDFERRDGQEFVIDLVLGMDTAPSRAERRLAGHGRLRNPRGRSQVGRRERPGRPDRDLGAANRRRVSAPPQVEAVEVTVHKPHAPIQATFEDVALTINRSRQ